MYLLSILLLTFTPVKTETLYVKKPVEFIKLNTPITNSIRIFTGDDTVHYQLMKDTLIFSEYQDSLRVIYRSALLKSLYRLNEFVEEDSALGEEEDYVYIERKEIEGSSFRISGKKDFTVRVGGGEDVQFEQSLNMYIGGELGKGFRVEGAFVDNSSSLESSTSRELNSLDEAYIKASSENISLKLGNLWMEGPFSSYRTKGAELELRNERMFLRGNIGFERGISKSLYIKPESGRQGPYLLLREETQAGVKIVEGSEKVWLDGRLLKRGKDYTIDYGTGSIIFAPSNVITSFSRIFVDFQYRRRSLTRRNTYIETGVFSKGMMLKISGYEEKDDLSSLRHSLTAEDIKSLQDASDSTEEIPISGAEFVGDGNGDYIKNGDIFVYVGRGKGDYKITFSYVGGGMGDYIYDSPLGGYRYVGDGLGEYTPIRYIEIPQMKRRVEAILTKSKEKGVYYTLDLKATQFNRNLISTQKAVTGNLYSLKGGWIEKASLGIIDVSIEHRLRDRNYSSPFREYGADYYYKWLQEERSGNMERMTEFSTTWYPFDYLSIGIQKGRLYQGNVVSNRDMETASLTTPLGMYISREDIRKSGEGESFGQRREGIELSYKINKLTPFVGTGRVLSDTSYTIERHGGVRLEAPFPSRIELKRLKEKTQLLDILEFRFNIPQIRNLRLNMAYDYIDRQREYSRSKTHLLELSWNFNKTDPSLLFWGTHRVNMNGGKRREERFTYVGEGYGEYSFDPATGRYYRDPLGSYNREVLLRELDETVLENSHFIGNYFNRKGLFELDWNISYIDRNEEGKFSPFSSEGVIFRKIGLATHIIGDFASSTFIPSIEYSYNQKYDRELWGYNTTESSNDLRTELSFPVARWKFSLGGELRLNRTLIEKELSSYEKERRLYERTDWIFTERLTLSLELSLKNTSIYDGVFYPGLGNISTVIYSVKPGIVGGIGEYSLSLNLEVMYGKPPVDVPLYGPWYFLPRGVGYMYNVSIARNVSRSLTLRFSGSGDGGENKKGRNVTALSLSMEF